MFDTKSSRTIGATLAVVSVIVIAVIAGTIARVSMTSGKAKTAAPETASVESFPVPSDATVMLPLTVGDNPPFATMSWKTSGTLDEDCQKWGDLFRGWIDQGVQQNVNGDYNAGVVCNYLGKKNGLAANLRVAVYGTDEPQATLSVTGTK